MRLAGNLGQVEPSAPEPEQVPLGAGAQQELRDPARLRPQAGQAAEDPRRAWTENGTIPIRFAISSITSHSSRASPAGGTTASVYWMKGVV